MICRTIDCWASSLSIFTIERQLRDFGAEQWNRYRHPGRLSTYAQTTAGERVVYFEQSDHLDVDAERACEFVTCSFDYDRYARVQAHAGIESARFWLNETILTLPTGKSQRYQEMAVRGQYFARLAERLNLTPAEVDQYLISHAVKEVQQLDLFSMAA
ncbi:hypothetical protein [Paraburkholderia youngii]|uniref:hypothetical protein n=1 Tax=Paraburkholderia youngii TaxID=2782701 RepID=UPI001FE8C015|nr:hypothetical protein [Paraburkholderia youngii]